MITWSYYGMKGWTYLFGEGKSKEMIFKVIFCFFVFVGAVSSLGSVLNFSDAALFAMGVVKRDRAVSADADRQARAEKLHGPAEIGRD